MVGHIDKLNKIVLESPLVKDASMQVLVSPEEGWDSHVMRVLELGDLSLGELTEIAFFDTYAQGDQMDFSGAWSVYPYLPSGNLLVNDRTNGLFILSMP